MFRKLVAVILFVCLMLTTTALAQPTELNANVAALKGPTAMGMVKMMEDHASEYNFTIASAIDEMTPKLVKGELDIAAVPANLASVLYNNTKGPVQVLAINTLGVLYIVENGSTVASVQDLRGRTIFASGKGATPEYALNYVLSQNGIDPEKDVTIEWKSEHSECLAALVSTEGAVAMLPQPFATTAQMKQPGVQIVLDMNQMWDELQEGNDQTSKLITGVMVVRTEFAEQHPETVAAFMDAYQQSVAYVNENNDQAAALIGRYDIIPEAVAKVALPYCRIVYIDGQDMKTQLSGYLKVLFDQNPAAVGGALPDDAFYFQK